MLKTAGAEAAWGAYGVDVTEGWREDGFVPAFADASAGRRRVAAAARLRPGRHLQHFNSGRRGAAHARRRHGRGRYETSMPYHELPAAAVVGLPWAGPSDGGVLP